MITMDSARNDNENNNQTVIQNFEDLRKADC